MIQQDTFEQLKKYGVHDKNVRDLTKSENPDLLLYLDIIHTPELQPVIAVVEDDKQPLMYVVRAENLPIAEEERRAKISLISRLLACRATASYLCLVGIGQMVIYPCTIQSDTNLSNMSHLTVQEEDPNAISIFQRLIQGDDAIFPSQTAKFFTSLEMHNLLKSVLSKTYDHLLESSVFGEKDDDEAITKVLAMVGRAVFLRFLADRGIANSGTFEQLYQISATEDPLKNAFETPELAALVCTWLDETFNGELLPFLKPGEKYLGVFKEIFSTNSSALRPLSLIMAKSDSLDQDPLWPLVDFAHVPVGLLSEVYETFASKFMLAKKRKDSIYYTPYHIAETVVNQAFNGLEYTNSTRKIRVLDPTTGAGVFLVLAFRKLVEQRWKSTGLRPDTQAIREILYNQLCGLDINKHALTLAALALYLIAIELDPTPEPPSKLVFEKNLIGSVLIEVSSQTGCKFGSLDSNVPKDLLGVFDLVIGNPPWNSWGIQEKLLNERANEIALEVIAERSPETDLIVSYKNPNKIPDLPFIWQAMKFARSGGVIAMIVHARLILGSETQHARKILFKNLRLYGIINATSLRSEKRVWPGNQAPFIMLFARNVKPEPLNSFWYFCPFLDLKLSQKGKLRVDPIQASVLTHKDVNDNPEVFKILYRGNQYDLKIMLRLKMGMSDYEKAGLPFPLTSLKDYWKSENKLSIGDGYVRGKPEMQKEIPISIKNLNGKNLDIDYKKYVKKISGKFLVQVNVLSNFIYSRLQWSRAATIYKPPLVLVMESPINDYLKPKAMISLDPTPLIYSESFIGFSSAGHPQSIEIAKYLFVLLNSKFATYFVLMISSKFGVERDNQNPQDLKSIPIVPFQYLANDLKHRIAKIADKFISTASQPTFEDFEKLNSLVFELYGFSSWEIQSIQDTLATQLPFRSNIEKSDSAPDLDDLSRFLNHIRHVLKPFLAKSNLELNISEIYSSTDDRYKPNWLYFVVSVKEMLKDVNQISISTFLLIAAERIAIDSGVSRITIELNEDTIVVGILNQFRYWTLTQATSITNDLAIYFG